jgi:hypothetical protein
LDGEHRLALERLTTLDEQIATCELAAGLQGPLQPGGQVSQEPAERAQTRIQDIFKPLQKELEATGAPDMHDKIKKLEIAMGEFQSATMALMRPDAEMEASDELNKSDSELDEDEPKAKTAKRTDSEAKATDAMDAEEEWTTVLGPQARRAQKEHRLAQKSLQDIARKIQMSSTTMQPQRAGTAKGNGKGKSPGKGPLCFIRPAADAVKPTVRPSRWDEGPPLSAGTNFPPAGALWGSTPAPSPGGAASSSAAPTEAEGQTKKTGITVELSDGEWKEVLANRGGDGHLS